VTSKLAPSSRDQVILAVARGRLECPGRARSRCRALTLIEILIVISLLLAAAGLMVPMFTSTLADREFDNILDRVAGHLMSARLESMERRVPIEVTWMDGALQTRIFDTDALETVNDRSFEDGTVPELEMESSTGDENQPPLEVLGLPVGIRCLEIEPVLDVSGLEPQSESDPIASTPLRIAIYLPDGSVIERGTRWIVDEQDRMATLVIDHRTGLPMLNRRRAVEPVEQKASEEMFEGPADLPEEVGPAGPEQERTRS